MKLYLSSYHLGKRAEEFADLFQNKKVALISNALDFSNDLERRKKSTQKELDDLTSLGLKPTNLDLRNYFGKQADLERDLEEFGGVWVRGGNAFILRKAFAYSGLDSILKKLKNSDFVYSGYSAGACLAALTLKGIDLIDDSTIVPELYKKHIIWDGLGFVEYSIVPHYNSNHFESQSIKKSINFFIENKMPFIALRDGEDLLENI